MTDPAVVQLVETRVGQPLSMEQVRETIDHLVGLGRFEDMRVFAEPASARRRTASACAGSWCRSSASAASRSNPAPALIRRRPSHGDQRAVWRVAAATRECADIVRALSEYLRGRGYRRPVDSAPTFVPGAAPRSSMLMLSIDPGPRTTIGEVSVDGDNAAVAGDMF